VFNEGLASLYEQSAERDGRIIGQTNWRLRGLQSAIRKGMSRRLQRSVRRRLASSMTRIKGRTIRRPLPMPLPAGAGSAAEVLPDVSQERGNRPDWGRVTQIGPRQTRSGRVQAEVGSRSPEAAIRLKRMRRPRSLPVLSSLVACRLSPGCIESFNRVGIAPRVRLGLLSTKSRRNGIDAMYGSHRSWREVAGLSHARGDAHAVNKNNLRFSDGVGLVRIARP